MKTKDGAVKSANKIEEATKKIIVERKKST